MASLYLLCLPQASSSGVYRSSQKLLAVHRRLSFPQPHSILPVRSIAKSTKSSLIMASSSTSSTRPSYRLKPFPHLRTRIRPTLLDIAIHCSHLSSLLFDVHSAFASDCFLKYIASDTAHDTAPSCTDLQQQLLGFICFFSVVHCSCVPICSWNVYSLHSVNCIHGVFSD